MIQKSGAVALAAMIVVGFVSSVAIAQSDDPFGSETDTRKLAGNHLEKTLTGRSVDSIVLTPDHSGRPGPASEQALNDKTEWKLATTMVEGFVFPEVPFSEVIEHFRDKYEISLLLDETANDDELAEETIVFCSLENVSLERALQLLLDRHHATFIVRSGVVHVISKDVEDDQEFFETRIFDCEGLVQALPGTIPSVIPAAKTDEKEPDSIDTRTTLEKLVQENVGMDSWINNGQGDAIIREINGKLLVRNSGPNLRDTRRFLEVLNSRFTANK